MQMLSKEEVQTMSIRCFCCGCLLGKGLWGFGQNRAPPAFLIKVLRAATLWRASPRYLQEGKP